MKFTVSGKLDGTNEYTTANRNNRYGGAKMKKENQKLVIFAITRSKLAPITNYPIKLSVTWYEPNRRRDIDNITFGVKFILDALVETGILKNDSQRYVTKIDHEVKVDKENPRIEVEIIEGNKKHEQSI